MLEKTQAISCPLNHLRLQNSYHEKEKKELPPLEGKVAKLYQELTEQGIIANDGTVKEFLLPPLSTEEIHLVSSMLHESFTLDVEGFKVELSRFQIFKIFMRKGGVDPAWAGSDLLDFLLRRTQYAKRVFNIQCGCAYDSSIISARPSDSDFRIRVSLLQNRVVVKEDLLKLEREIVEEFACLALVQNPDCQDTFETMCMRFYRSAFKSISSFTSSECEGAGILLTLNGTNTDWLFYLSFRPALFSLEKLYLPLDYWVSDAKLHPCPLAVGGKSAEAFVHASLRLIKPDMESSLTTKDWFRMIKWLTKGGQIIDVPGGQVSLEQLLFMQIEKTWDTTTLSAIFSDEILHIINTSGKNSFRTLVNLFNIFQFLKKKEINLEPKAFFKWLNVSDKAGLCIVHLMTQMEMPFDALVGFFKLILHLKVNKDEKPNMTFLCHNHYTFYFGATEGEEIESFMGWVLQPERPAETYAPHLEELFFLIIPQLPPLACVEPPKYDSERLLDTPLDLLHLIALISHGSAEALIDKISMVLPLIRKHAAGRTFFKNEFGISDLDEGFSLSWLMFLYAHKKNEQAYKFWQNLEENERSSIAPSLVAHLFTSSPAESLKYLNYLSSPLKFKEVKEAAKKIIDLFLQLSSPAGTHRIVMQWLGEKLITWIPAHQKGMAAELLFFACYFMQSQELPLSLQYLKRSILEKNFKVELALPLIASESLMTALTHDELNEVKGHLVHYLNTAPNLTEMQKKNSEKSIEIMIPIFDQNDCLQVFQACDRLGLKAGEFESGSCYWETLFQAWQPDTLEKYLFQDKVAHKKSAYWKLAMVHAANTPKKAITWGEKWIASSPGLSAYEANQSQLHALICDNRLSFTEILILLNALCKEPPEVRLLFIKSIKVKAVQELDRAIEWILKTDYFKMLPKDTDLKGFASRQLILGTFQSYCDAFDKQTAKKTIVTLYKQLVLYHEFVVEAELFQDQAWDWESVFFAFDNGEMSQEAFAKVFFLYEAEILKDLATGFKIFSKVVSKVSFDKSKFFLKLYEKQYYYRELFAPLAKSPLKSIYQSLQFETDCHFLNYQLTHASDIDLTDFECRWKEIHAKYSVFEAKRQKSSNAAAYAAKYHLRINIDIGLACFLAHSGQRSEQADILLKRCLDVIANDVRAYGENYFDIFNQLHMDCYDLSSFRWESTDILPKNTSHQKLFKFLKNLSRTLDKSGTDEDALSDPSLNEIMSHILTVQDMEKPPNDKIEIERPDIALNLDTIQHIGSLAHFIGPLLNCLLRDHDIHFLELSDTFIKHLGGQELPDFKYLENISKLTQGEVQQRKWAFTLLVGGLENRLIHFSPQLWNFYLTHLKMIMCSADLDDIKASKKGLNLLYRDLTLFKKELGDAIVLDVCCLTLANKNNDSNYYFKQKQKTLNYLFLEVKIEKILQHPTLLEAINQCIWDFSLYNTEIFSVYFNKLWRLLSLTKGDKKNRLATEKKYAWRLEILKYGVQITHPKVPQMGELLLETCRVCSDYEKELKQPHHKQEVMSLKREIQEAAERWTNEIMETDTFLVDPVLGLGILAKINTVILNLIDFQHFSSPKGNEKYEKILEIESKLLLHVFVALTETNQESFLKTCESMNTLNQILYVEQNSIQKNFHNFCLKLFLLSQIFNIPNSRDDILKQQYGNLYLKTIRENCASLRNEHVLVVNFFRTEGLMADILKKWYNTLHFQTMQEKFENKPLDEKIVGAIQKEAALYHDLAVIDEKKWLLNVLTHFDENKHDPLSLQDTLRSLLAAKQMSKEDMETFALLTKRHAGLWNKSKQTPLNHVKK